MASDTVKCPHCECRVRLDEVEKEDGICPECGQLVMASNLAYDFPDESDDFDEMNGEFEDDENDDDISDDEDDENPDMLDELNDELEIDDPEMQEEMPSGGARRGRPGRKKRR